MCDVQIEMMMTMMMMMMLVGGCVEEAAGAGACLSLHRLRQK